ncbi:MAG: lipopolysaccharide biosynthesis protein [Bacteroidota bacterium]
MGKTLRILGFRINATGALQLFQMMRFGANLLTGIGLSKLIDKPADIATYETAILYFGLLSFAPINAIVYNYIAAYKQAPDARKPAVLVNSFRFASWAGGVAAILAMGIVLAFYDFPLLLTLFYGGFVLFNFLCMLTEYDLMLRNRLGWLLFYGSFFYGLRLAGVVLPILLGYDFTVVFGVLALVSAGQFAAFLLFRRDTPRRFSRLQMGYQFAKIRPLFFKQIVGGGAAYINGVLVTIFMSATDFVLFRYAARDFPLVPMLMIGIVSASAAMFAEVNKREEHLRVFSQLRKSTRRMMRLSFPVVMLLIVSSHWLFRVVYNDEFVAAAPVFNLFMLLTIPRMIVPQAYLTGKQLNHALLRVAVIEIITHIILATVLIQFFGLYGVVMSAVVAYALDRGLLAWYVVREGYAFREIIDIGEWLAWSAALIALVLLANFAGWHLPADFAFS